MTTNSRRERLLDDDSSLPSSDDYVAFAGASSAPPSACSNLTRFCAANKKSVGIGVGISFVLLLAIIGIMAYTRSSSSSPANSDVPAVAMSYRLPANVMPMSYVVNFTSISLDPTASAPYTGDVVINARITLNAMPAFVLHSLYLDISFVTIHINNSLIDASSYHFYLYGQTESSTQLLVIEGLGGYVFPVTDSLRIHVGFSGSAIRNQGQGIFLASYNDTETKKINFVAVTQFEPTSARRAFPCFDELQMKATFTISIAVSDPTLTVLSNGAIDTTESTPGGGKRVNFKPTCVQSVYLIALTVGPWKSVDADKSIGLTYPFKDWGRPDSNLYLSLQQITNRGAQVHKWFHDTLNVTYPQGKVDQLASPPRFGGAMENYGLVIYDESYLYLTNDTTSSQWGASVNVNAHELAHYIWGDYMTPLWWSNNWLKEGSATFWSYVGQQAIMEGDWHSDSLAVLEYQESAFLTDANQGAPPLINDAVLTPADIQAHFGDITYSKGGSFLRMIRGIMGQDSFYTACRQFLADFALSNALSVQFFAILENWSPIKGQSPSMYDILFAWATTAGFPRVIVTPSDAGSDGSVNWTITQQRYGSTNNSFFYPIYLEFVRVPKGGKLALEHTIFSSSSALVTVNDGDLVKLNANRNGFYRVHYPASVLEAWAVALRANPTLVSQQDRIGFLLDAYQLMIDQYTSPSSWGTVLNLTLYLASETDYAPLQAGITHVSRIWERLRYAAADDDRRAVTSWIQHTFGPAACQLDWTPINSTSHLTGLLQQALGPLACKFNVSKCTEMATSYMNEWAMSGNLPHANVRRAVFQYATIQQNTFDKLVECYFNDTLSDNVAYLCLSGFLAHANELQIFMALTNYFSGNFRIRSSDTLFSIVQTLAQVNDIGRQVVLSYFIANPASWSNVLTKVTNGELQSMMFVFVGSAQTQQQLDQATGFFDSRIPGIDPQAGNTWYAGMKSYAQSNIAWVTTNWPPIKSWITQQLSSTYFSCPTSSAAA